MVVVHQTSRMRDQRPAATIRSGYTTTPELIVLSRILRMVEIRMTSATIQAILIESARRALLRANWKTAGTEGLSWRGGAASPSMTRTSVSITVEARNGGRPASNS